MYNTLGVFLHTIDMVILRLISTTNIGSPESAYREFPYSWLARVASCGPLASANNANRSGSDVCGAFKTAGTGRYLTRRVPKRGLSDLDQKPFHRLSQNRTLAASTRRTYLFRPKGSLAIKLSATSIST